ncbi:SF1B family DNA helicase RecD2 [Nicoliella lavandulae]|uniref:ATP-dependent RecD2 DNA helicase n=1 Tax=Nicoliella lavandulae TaxID=3082954 RepID=A0ABU8SMJ0_9LACO
MADSVDLFDDNHSNPSEPLSLTGTVQAIFFESPDNFYKVLSVKIKSANFKWNSDDIIAVGSFGEMDLDAEYQFTGELVEHPKYGQQFKVTKYEGNTPKTSKGLIAYLSSDDFPGIGTKTAEKIVEQLGNNLIEKVINNPDVLKQLDLSPKQKEALTNGIKEHNGVEQIIIGLNSYGFSSNLAGKIYNFYKDKTLSVIKNNPYKLVEDINGISFKKADQIASQMGFTDDSIGRLRAGIMTALSRLSIKSGGTYAKLDQLVNESLKLLNSSRDGAVTIEAIGDQIIALAKANKIVGEQNKIYLRTLYEAEWEIAENIKRIEEAGDDTQALPDDQLDQMIRKIEFDNRIEYDASQISALKMAMKSSVFLLTGGPGTGKTTIIKGILSLYAKINDLSLSIADYVDDPYPFLLAAPTGRAAKRMRETTGAEASTIHKLLGLNINDDQEQDDAKETTVDGKLLIVDEMSMVDTYLFRRLINAVPDDMKVILVGDRDQLPSVGPGQVFNDLLQSKRIPSLELNTIHRQDDDSTIIELAHYVKNGHLPQDFMTNQSDRSFISCTARQIQSVIEQIVGKAHRKGFTSTDIQVLAPMYKGPIGVNNLNTIIQSIMNPKTSADQKEVEYRGVHYRIGDKVLQLVNSSENDVFNGDIGKIVSIETQPNNSSKDKLVIAFDDSEVTYQRKEWDQITLAYCTTIHKAQGSEFKMVILPIVPQYTIMLKRNLLYTAITRASKLLVLAGDVNSFVKCVETPSTKRWTSLCQRLRTVIKDVNQPTNQTESKVETVTNSTSASNDEPKSDKQILTEQLINSGKIDPMIGMDGISPDQFM